MNEHSKIDEIVDFIDFLDNKYSFNEKELRHQLQVLKEKHNSKVCKLGLIGESNAGKSSFINSLLGESLLESDNLLDTTKINTIITYCDKKSIKITKKNGDQFIINNDIGDTIKKYTSDLSIINNVDTITIYHPSLFLKEGINIVDTPGICSIDEKLNESTKIAIGDILDTLLILTPSVQLFSDSLNKFIDAYAYDNIDNCIFVVTKLDLIKLKEIDRIKKFCTNLIKKNWNVNEDRFVLYSSIINESTCSKDFCEYLQNESYKTRNFICNYIKKQKEVIKEKKELFILDKTLLLLDSNLSKSYELYKLKHKKLEESIKPDFDDFVTQKENNIKNYIENEIKRINDIVENQGRKGYETIVNSYFSKIDTSRTPEDLKKNCENLETDLKNAVVEYYKSTASLLEKILEWYSNEIKSFENQFLEIYNSLPLIEYKLDSVFENTSLIAKSEYIKTAKTINSSVSETSNRTVLSDFFSDNTGPIAYFISQMGTKFGLPGILISIFGGLLIEIFNDLFGTMKFTKQKEEIKIKLRKSIYDCFNEFENICKRKIDNFKSDILNESYDLFDEYNNRYKETVDKLRSADQEEKQIVEIKMKDIKDEIDRINTIYKTKLPLLKNWH